MEEQANVSVDATELAAQLADAKAQLAQMEELKAAAAELQILKQKAEQEAEAMRIQQEAELKQSYANMVASLGFVAEEKAESVAELATPVKEDAKADEPKAEAPEAPTADAAEKTEE